jgi:asparagine synthase (glutamine-hydrolysing)
MSAIWGFISLEKDVNELNKRIYECKELMTAPYKECAIDRFEETMFDNGFFACGIQYFTEEAKFEKLPIHDKCREIIFTGDIVLNAREKLIKEIQRELSSTELETLGKIVLIDDFKYKTELEKWPDGALAYAAYTLWQDGFVEHIQGLFAIAVYDMKNKFFRLYTDHMGCRCVYYSICGKELFFSSLCKPITNSMLSEYFGISEKFIAGAEYSDTPVMLLFPGLSPFENIYQLIRGNYLVAKFAKGSLFKEKLVEYYNPAKNKNQRMRLEIPKYNPDKYCRDIFRKVFWECVEDALRSNTDISATISSGLDSTSVAAVAASILAKEEKSIYSYTSVPLKDYVNTTYDPYYITDESKGVKRFCEVYKNIKPEFLDCGGKSALTDMDEQISKFEVPCKALINQVWIMEIVEKMISRGSKVLLNGQFGNFTISAGNSFARTYHELFRGNIREAKKQLAAFGRRYSVPRKILFSDLLGNIFRELLFVLNLDREYCNSFDHIYLRKKLLKKYKIKSAERKLYKMRGYTSCESRSKQNNVIMDPTICGTMDIYDSKVSIYYGILQRDPTMDKRIVDLCMALPDFAFVDDGIERRMVRSYLDDMIPNSIRNNYRHRGVQSPDALLRLQRYDKEKKEIVFSKQLFNYLDEKNVRELFKHDINEDNYRDIVRILALDKFIKEFG